MRTDVADPEIPRGETVVKGTISAGDVEHRVEELPSRLIARGDTSMSRGNEQGRNRVVFEG